MLLEICSNSFSSAMQAQLAGAHRIELCAALEVGGITPSASTVQLTCQILHKRLNDIATKVHVLIRPRSGDFCYSPIELGLIRRDILFCQECGADGLAIGLLNPDGTVDQKNTAELARLSKNMSLTFHRAFDLVANPFEALEKIIDMGFDTILTSGQATSAMEGSTLIRQLIEKAAGRIDIMPGGGIHAGNIQELAKQTLANSFHLSAKSRVQKSISHFDNDLFETEYWETNAEEVRRVLEKLKG